MRGLFMGLVALSPIAGCGSKAAPVENMVTAGSAWRIEVPDGDPESIWVTLLGGGLMSYTQDGPNGEYVQDGTDTWWVKSDTLYLQWSDGYSLETYPLVAGARTLQGTKTSKSWGDQARPCTITRL